MKTLLLGMIIGAQAIALSAATITIPNGDFSNSANNGSIQGSLLSGGATATPLGSGPWNARTTGLAGLLLPPTASIGSGTANVSGLLGLGALGQSNTAQFYQTISGQSYQAFTTYTLSATINSATALSLSLLGNNGIGIALTRGGNTNVVADSLSASPSLVSLSPLGGNAYQLSLQYASAGSAPVGDIGVRLFAGMNSSLLSANMLGNVTFDAVTLTAVPEPSSTALMIGGFMVFIVVSARVRKAVPRLMLVAALALAGHARAALLTVDIPLNVTLEPNSTYKITADVNAVLGGTLLEDLLDTLTPSDSPLQILDGDGNVLGTVPVQNLIDLLTGTTGDVVDQVDLLLTTAGNEVIDPVVRVLSTPIIQVTNPTVTPVPSARADQRPTVKIVSRKRSDLKLRLKGTAADDGQVTGVEVTINGRKKKVSGTNKWKVNLRLKEGRNRIVARSFDNTSKVSAPRRVTVKVKKD